MKPCMVAAYSKYGQYVGAVVVLARYVVHTQSAVNMDSMLVLSLCRLGM